ncbi:CFEM domain protein [Metarhizium rileyi]|uniref:CFEM domain protein n=1 Tax=Metarhizium rileyi (strain RCEF 4871) TaxID=1649241 RepID=A0A167GRR3_METRR|nr:CFEM domain protein [Metarhizium rileyi RCEF 4871]TWU75202.1 hypothetical protein ED733_005033 [Metarhizium rileyi]
MKATFVTLAVAGLAAAQSLGTVSGCVRACIEKAFPKVGCIGTPAEVGACACKPETMSKLMEPVTKCASETGCTSKELIDAQSIVAAQCKAALSTGFGSATGSATAVHSESASGLSTVSMPPAMTTGTGGVPSHSKNQTTTGTGGATGTTKAPTASHSGSATATGSGSVPTTTGAAAAGPVVGALAAVLAAALAL